MAEQRARKTIRRPPIPLDGFGLLAAILVDGVFLAAGLFEAECGAFGLAAAI
jgi:hypothetical protein